MVNIKSVADLENEYQQIEELTDTEYKNYIENILDKSEKELDNSNTRYLIHEDVFSKARRVISGEESILYI